MKLITDALLFIAAAAAVATLECYFRINEWNSGKCTDCGENLAMQGAGSGYIDYVCIGCGSHVRLRA